MKPNEKLIWIVAAGTGGHIFPGLSLARKIKEKDASIKILFFGSKDRLEAQLVPKYGYSLKTIYAGRWKGRGVLGRIWGLCVLAIGFAQILGRLLWQEKPRFMLSVGGYVSFPMALACGLLGVPVYLLEPNIKAGLANKIVSRWAKRAFCAPGSDAVELFKCPTEDLGCPVREDLISLGNLRAKVQKILVLGGSQGAKALNEAVMTAFKNLELGARGVTLTVQSGAAHLESALSFHKNLSLDSSVQIKGFIDDVPHELRDNDLVIARSGAMTVAELATVGMPTIFVPFPFSADDHQRKNAGLLEQDGAAWMVDQKDIDFEKQLQTLVSQIVFGDDSKNERELRSKQFQKWARPHAAEKIVDKLLAQS